MLVITVDIFFCCLNVILRLNQLSPKVLLHKYLDLLYVASSAYKLLIFYIHIFLGRFLVIFGELLERMLIYNGILSGLL